MTRQKLIGEFERLSNDNNFPEANDKRKRGRDFEKLINNLLELEGLEPRTGFRPKGEEIDGSFFFGHSVFLIEAKWHKSEMPASSIYQFKGKVDGKLIGTIGVYLSMSGFSSEAVDALTYGKSIDIILFDNEDFKTCIYEDNGFTQVLSRKLRMATEKGTVFYQVNSLTVSSEPTDNKSKVSIQETKTSNLISKRKTTGRKQKEELLFIVEGVTDQYIIASFAERIFSNTNSRKEINILVAGGKYSIAKLANVVQGNYSDKTKIVLVADSDYNKEETLNLLSQNLDNNKITTIIPDPEIEVWLSDLKITNRKHLRNMIVHSKKGKEEQLNSMIERIDIESLRKNDSSFDKLYKVLTK